MNRASMFMGGLVALAALVGCGKDKVVLGLGHTYEQILACSRGFEIDREFPFRWRFDEATVHLDLGDGTHFTLEASSGGGFVNHPNPSQIKPDVADWMGAHIVDATIFINELVSLESARLPEKTLALMSALSMAGWKPRRPLASVAEIEAALAAPPHHGEWVFEVDPISWTPGLWGVVGLMVKRLEVGRCLVADGRVDALAVVEDLDELEDRGARGFA